METERFDADQYTDEQLVALLALKARFAEGGEMFNARELGYLRFSKWLLEHGVYDGDTIKGNDDLPPAA